jgi:MerR family copper efflux transcriptional regulator
MTPRATMTSRPAPRRPDTPSSLPGAARAARPSGGPHRTTAEGPRGAPMNIGEAAAAAGLSARMLRHYEAIGLIAPAVRTEAGYRRYDESDLRTLRFVRHARELGFGLDRIGALVSLWRDPRRASADVKRIALAHVAELDRQIELLRRMRDALAHTADHCHGDRRSGCPILEDLERG